MSFQVFKRQRERLADGLRWTIRSSMFILVLDTSLEEYEGLYYNQIFLERLLEKGY
jgi:hypothetical protein